MSTRSLVPEDEPILFIDSSTERDHQEVEIVATQDHDLIRRWADARRAEPATGEASESGPGVVDVQDGGAGIRFNFPGVNRYRPIPWEEWFANLTRHELVFVYERDRQGSPLSGRYRLVTMKTLKTRVAPAVK